ncbi:MAG: hypothetical protein LBH86_04055, partial [Oscillospiraceae bacterium]|nr:hypothetical protein [Oscillospiraceae bacterium]
QKPGKPLKLRKIFRRQQATLAILKNTGLFFSIFCFLMNVVMALLFFDVFDPFMDMFFWNSASPLQGLIPRPLYRAAKNFIDNDNLWPFFLVCLAGLLLYIVSQILYLLRYRKFRREWKARHMSPQQTSR